MAYTIGPKFNNAVDVNNLASIYLEGDKTIDERNRKDWEQSLAGIKALGSGIDTAVQHYKYDKYMKMVQDERQALLDALNAKKSALAEAENSPAAPEKTSTELTAVRPFEGAFDAEYDPEVWEKSTQYLMQAYPAYDISAQARNKYKVGRRAGF